MTEQRLTLGRWVKQLPGATLLRKRLRIARARRRLARFADREAVFTDYYRSRFWSGGAAETVSGAGSTLEYTAQLRAQLPALLTRLGVETLLDAPCGDFNWFRHLDRSGFHYIGGDIVASLVAENRRRYGDVRTQFLHLDICRDALPNADLWMCRDCLFHLSEQDIRQALQNFLRSGIEWLLTTTYPRVGRNLDIPTGHFRQLNLEGAPFQLPPPRVTIDDWIEGFAPRVLGLWHRDALARADWLVAPA